MMQKKSTLLPTKLHMADDAQDSNTTQSGRVKGAVKAWQFLMEEAERSIIQRWWKFYQTGKHHTLTHMKYHNTFQFQGTKEDH